MSTKKITAILSAILLINAVAQDPPPAEPLPEAEVAPAPASEKVDLPETTSLTIEARGLLNAKPPLFFSATTDTRISVGPKFHTVSTTTATFDLLQGKADANPLTLKVIGTGEILKVEGEEVRDWAVRHLGGERFLDIRPKQNVKSFSATILADLHPDELPTQLEPITFGPGKAVGYSSSITVTASPTVDIRVTKADGLSPARVPDGTEHTWKFQTRSDHALSLHTARSGAALAPVELVNAELEGTVDLANRSTNFVLTGEARVTAGGAHLDILSGHAAVSALPDDANFTLSLHDPAQPVYRLTFPEPGSFPVRIEFQAGLSDRENWRALDFKVPAGAIVPVSLSGIGEDVRFDPHCSVFPSSRDGRHIGFLPASGNCSVAWQTARDAGEGKLFFASDARIETSVGAGLLRQTAQLQLNILQGKLDGIQILLEGDGEILGVEGGNVLAWSVTPAADDKGRMLDIKTARPAEGSEKIIIRSQSALGEFPVEATPMRFTPQGAVRHSGYLQVLSQGAVALEITSPSGLIQMAPGGLPDGVRQIFLYRFPSAQHSYSISARQILPEVAVSQTTIYEMTETDRVITGRIELDITKAPLREWSFLIPESYDVSAASGASVADYIRSGEAVDGMRSLKILFTQAVADRQLIEFRLERNIAAAAGEWLLPALGFPEVKSVRGNIGVATVAGYRVSPGKLENVSEIPQNLFPLQFAGLQQTFRQRGTEWSAAVEIEALPQSVQADVFHLYSLKEGIAYGSVLIDYSIIGSPVSEWRIDVPTEIGNLAVESQNVQSWRREGDQVIVTLHQPALGETTLLLTFEQPMDARNGLLRPGQVAPAKVQGERGHIQVVSPSQVRQEITASEGLLKMEPSELPAELQPLSSSPSLAVYQYTSRPFDLQMNVQWFEPGETVDQVVDFADLKSRVSSDGQVITEARLFVKTRGRKALRLKLPEGTKLWETRVNNRTVSARIDQGETLVPLPASIDPSTPVEVFVRIGQTSTDPDNPTVTSPILLTPTLINSWTVAGDPDRRLLPAGNNTPELAHPVLTETGFEWLHTRAGYRHLAPALAIIIGALLCCCARAGAARQFLGIIAFVIAAILCGTLIEKSLTEREVNRTQLEFVAPVIEPGEALTLQLRNLAPWQSLVSIPGAIAIGAGLALLLAGLVIKRHRQVALPAWACILGGLLAQHGGAPVFFGSLGIFVILYAIIPTYLDWFRSSKNVAPEETTDPASGLTPTILVLACTLGLGTGNTRAAGIDPPPIADTATQTLRIEDGRLFGVLELSVTGRTSDILPLLHAPAILTGFQGEGLRVTKRSGDNTAAYWIVLERDGTASATLSYELALPDATQGFKLPTAPAAVQHLSVQIDQGGWQITSPNAVRTQPRADLPLGSSGAHLVLGPAGGAAIKLQPMGRDLSAEKATFFAEVSNLFIPGPGIVDGRHKVTIRPSRGQLRELDCNIPEGFTVSDVLNNNLASWRFDPDARSLHLDFNPPMSKPFIVMVETQQGSSALPAELTLTPLAVDGTESQVGMLGVAFGPDAQPEKSTPEGLSKVNHDDFDHSLLQTRDKGAPAVILSQAYRYGAERGSLQLTVAPVAPDVRAISKQTLSLGEERLVIAVDLNVDITRSGIFKLSFPIPDGLDIEAASGDGLASHTESKQDGVRIATLHLKGRTLGQQRFAITLAGSAPDPQEEWAVPKFALREASRQTGQLLVVPEQGIRAQPVARKHVSQLDARKLSQNRPGTLAFSLLQSEWDLKLRLETLDPWVTAQVIQDVTAREGLTKTRLSVAYRVGNAAVKSLRIKLTGLTADEQKTVRASGNAVSHIARLADAQDVWEIHFQRRILGDGRIDIDYQRATDRADGIENIHIAELVSAKQSAYWVAVRVSGHLEVAPEGALTRGWQAADWSSIPASLLNARNRAVPLSSGGMT